MRKGCNLKKGLEIGVIFLTTSAFFVLPPIARGVSGIIINEIMYDLPGADEKHEWLELYNSGSTEIDLTGWKFNDGANHVLNPPPEKGSRGSLIIAANGYALLAADATTLATDLPLYAGTIIDTAMSLNNTAAALKLINKDGQEVTSISYAKSLGANGNGKTLEWDGSAFKEGLIDGGTPGQANSVSAGTPSTPSTSPISSPSPSPSASASPIPAASPALTISPSVTPTPYQFSQNIFINEFLPYPSKDELEWVELFNGGSQTIDLTGWGLSDSTASHQPFQIANGTKIEPGACLVISLSKSFLNNDGDQVKLLWPDGQVVHSVSYPKAKQNFSCSRFDNQWLWTNQPTPGQANKKSSLSQPLSFSAAGAADATDATPPTIATLQESVTEQKPSSNQKTAASPTLNASPSPPALTSGSGEKQLAASTAQPLSKSSRPKTILSLISVLSVAALAALFLIRLRRRASIDND